jgi:hypothetical protein
MTSSFEGGQGSLGARRLEVGALHQSQTELQCPERLAPFVGGQARELLQSLLLLRDGLHVERDEGFHRRLRQHVDRLIEPGYHQNAVGCGRHLPEPFHFLEHERDENAAEELVFAQHLMQRRALAVPEGAQLPRFLQDRRIRGDRFIFGVSKVGTDFENQRRDVIQQTVGRKDVAGLDRQQIQQAGEPLRCQRPMLGSHPFGDEVPEVGADHEAAYTA